MPTRRAGPGCCRRRVAGGRSVQAVAAAGDRHAASQRRLVALGPAWASCRWWPGRWPCRSPRADLAAFVAFAAVPGAAPRPVPLFLSNPRTAEAVASLCAGIGRRRCSIWAAAPARCCARWPGCGRIAAARASIKPPPAVAPAGPPPPQHRAGPGDFFKCPGATWIWCMPSSPGADAGGVGTRPGAELRRRAAGEQQLSVRASRPEQVIEVPDRRRTRLYCSCRRP